MYGVSRSSSAKKSRSSVATLVAKEPPSQSDNLRGLGGGAVVGQNGAHRPEDLVAVHVWGVQAVPGAQHHGGGEGPFALWSADAVHRGRKAEDNLGVLAEQGHARAVVVELGEGGQRAHRHRGVRGVSDDHSGERVAEILNHGVYEGLGHEDAADGGALLAGLLGHLAHVADEQVADVAPRSTSGPSTAALRLSASTLTRTLAASRFFLPRRASAGRRRAGEGEARPGRRAGRGGRRSSRRRAGARPRAAGPDVERDLDHPVGDERGRRRGLGDHRHAGEEGAGDLLGECPRPGS